MRSVQISVFFASNILQLDLSSGEKIVENFTQQIIQKGLSPDNAVDMTLFMSKLILERHKKTLKTVVLRNKEIETIVEGVELVQWYKDILYFDRILQ